MENNTLYTRCPTCTTAFKVTEKLLTVAAGKVRCGACLAIFQATDYMLKPSERNKAPEPIVSQEPEQALATEQPIATEESLATEEPATIEQPVTQASNIDTSDSSHSQTTSETNEANIEPTQDIQPSSGQTMLADDYETEPQFEPPSQAAENSDFEPEPDFQSELNTPPPSDFQDLSVHDELEFTESPADPEINLDVVTDVEQDYLASDETQQESQIEPAQTLDSAKEMSEYDVQNHSQEFEEESAEIEQVIEQDQSTINLESPKKTEQDCQRMEPSLGDTDEIDPITEDFSSEQQELMDEAADSTNVDEEQALDFDDESEQFEPIQDFDTDQYSDTQYEEPDELELEDLSEQLAEQMQDTDADPDPLDEFESIVEEKNTDLRRNIIIAAVAILLFIGLQQVWSNRQALAWSESWGSSIKSVCQYLPCNLKARRDVSKIRLLQRQLSPDEENENQLDVKVLLTNEATFDQPYPTIKIAFSNKNGEQVSVKSFPPEDYLEPDSLNKLMPYGTEVHIHFKTELTHPDALGFEFIFE